MIRRENVGVVRLYEGPGFVGAGACTLVEALRANGLGDAVPRDRNGKKFSKWKGLIIALGLERAWVFCLLGECDGRWRIGVGVES